MIYLDHASTSIISKDILEEYHNILKSTIGNPSNSNHLGLKLNQQIDQARRDILKQLNLFNHTVIFVSSATEANNLAITGFATRNSKLGNTIVTSSIEHPSIIQPCTHLKDQGFQVLNCPIKDHNYDFEQLEQMITQKTILVALTEVNSETGLILPLNQLQKLKSKYPHLKILLDITQSLGHINSNSYDFIDFLSFSLHKLGGPKGLGILIKRKNILINPLIRGGDQEGNLRPGTLNAEAILLAPKVISMAKSSYNHYLPLKEYLYYELGKIPEIILNSDPKLCSNHIINFSTINKKSSIVFEELNLKEIYLSTKTSCQSKHTPTSIVIKELTKSDALALSSLRISLGRNNTLDELTTFIKTLKEILK